MLLVPQTKVRMPPIPAGLVERTELHAELDAGDVGGVTLVCAPPGYGKSWLLADWANRPSPVRTAWLTIDGDDNDPRRLWASVLAALAPHIPLTASKSIRSSFAWSPAEHTSLVSPFLAGSAIYALRPMFHLMLENVLSFDEILGGAGRSRSTGYTLAPGVRGGWNVPNAQIVAGAAAPIVWRDGESSAGLFLYFSYEVTLKK